LPIFPAIFSVVYLFEFNGARVCDPQQLRQVETVEIRCVGLKQLITLRLTEPRSKQTDTPPFFPCVRRRA
jgi:hypothetical protein